MEIGNVSLDEKAKRTRDLLSSFYSPDTASASPSSTTYSTNQTVSPLEAINTTSFDPDQYMSILVQKSNLEGLLGTHVQIASEIKNLDTDLQMLVYENYSKFISATDSIKRMNRNIVGMETNMENLLDKILSVQSRSHGVNSSLVEKREHIEKLHQKRNLLRKVQFIYDLPARLEKCIKVEAYADAVRYYTGAMPIFKAYGNSSFRDCKRASEEAITTIMNNLEEKVFSDSESIQARAEAALLLKRLDFKVDSLKEKSMEKLEQSLVDLQLKIEDINKTLVDPVELSEDGKVPASGTIIIRREVSVRAFAEAISSYRVIFPDSEQQLIKLAQDLISMHFETTGQYLKKQITSSDLLRVLRIVWTDVLLLEGVLNEESLIDYSLEAAKVALKQYVTQTFLSLLQNISDSLTHVHFKENEGVKEYSLQLALETSKKAVLQGSVDILSDLNHLLNEKLGLVVKLRDLVIDLVQEGFQDFFKALDDRFWSLSGRNTSASQDQSLIEGTHANNVFPGLVLVLSQLSVFVEQTTIPKVTEAIAASFSAGGRVRGYEYGPPFVPGEICRMFRSAGEKFLHLYINIRTQKIFVLLNKRFRTPNWVKHKEPREVHMFVDLFLQELEAIEVEVKQILPQGLLKHHQTESNGGSSTSSRSNPLREEKVSRSSTQRGRRQLLETHLAKLFKQKVEIFTKVEYTQESVITNMVKLSLKSFQELIRLQTCNRSGFQQIQLDMQFLRTPLKEIVEDKAAIDFLLDEVIIAASERCLDPVPLEPPILDKLIQAKLAKSEEQAKTMATL